MMHLCLSCYRLWPRDALFCGACGRSFGGRLCPGRHLSPPSARVCVQCGKAELTDPTASLPFGWLTTLLGGLSLLLAWKWVWHHLSLVYAVLVSVLNGMLSLLFDLPPHALERLTSRALAWGLVIALTLHLLPGRTGRDVRRAVFGWTRRVGHLVCGVIAVQIVRRLVTASRRLK